MRVNGTGEAPAPTTQSVEPAKIQAKKPVEPSQASRVDLDRTRADAQLQRVSPNQAQEASVRPQLNSALARELSARVVKEQSSDQPLEDPQASASDRAQVSAQQEEPVTRSRDGVSSNQNKSPI